VIPAKSKSRSGPTGSPDKRSASGTRTASSVVVRMQLSGIRDYWRWRGWFISSDDLRACGGPCFLCSCKESRQRNTPLAARPSGACRRWEFSEGTPMYLPKTPRIVRGATRGCTHRRHRALKETQEPKARAEATSIARTLSVLKEVSLPSIPLLSLTSFAVEKALQQPNAWSRGRLKACVRTVPADCQAIPPFNKGGQGGFAPAPAPGGSLLNGNTP
jgi:hypothetical protein